MSDHQILNMKLAIFCLWIAALGSISTEGMFDGVKQGFLACDKIKNVTILSDNFDFKYGHVPFINAQFSNLVKTLLDTPCVMVWVYMPLRLRSVRQERNSFNNFLEADTPTKREPPKSVIFDFLRDYSKADAAKNQQILLIVVQHIRFLGYFINDVKYLLKEIDSLQNKSVVVWCAKHNSFLLMVKTFDSKFFSNSNYSGLSSS